MVWIFLAIAVLLIFASPAIRNVGLAILGSALVVFLVIVVLNRQPGSPAPAVPTNPPVAAATASRKFDFDKYQQEKQDREDPDAKTRIPLSAVRFDQIRAVPGIEPGTLQTIRARLYNDSGQYTLTNYAYYLEVQDCLPDKPDDRHAVQCTTVFDQRDSVSTTVPPNQARDVVIGIAKDGAPPADAPPPTAPFKLLGAPRIELIPTSTRSYVSP